MKCKEHDRYNCWDPACKSDNAGQVGMDLNGDPTIGIGSGMTMDLTDGSLGISLGGGISLDLDGK